MDLPITQSSDYFLFIFERHAQEILSKIESVKVYSIKVSDFILHNFQGKVPTFKGVAQHLSMSPKNLQLKLKKENTSFSSILEKIREELAIKHLIQNEFSITDIAFFLGFSETSAFSRTFKRWKGISPREFRKKIGTIENGK